jgi:uncharacterized protein with HEPN domain
MQARDKQILNKIIAYSDDVAEFIGDITFEQFKADKKTMTSSAFTVSQIAELTKELSDELKSANSHIKWKGIKGFRNILVHRYEYVSLEAFWWILKEQVPALKLDVEAIIVAGNNEIVSAN